MKTCPAVSKHATHWKNIINSFLVPSGSQESFDPIHHHSVHEDMYLHIHSIRIPLTQMFGETIEHREKVSKWIKEKII